MKIYSKKRFIMGIVWLAVALLCLVKLAREGVLAQEFWHVLFLAAVGGRCLFDAVQPVEDPQKQAEKIAQAGRRLYGRWRFVVQNLGYALIVAALVSTLLAPNWAGIALFAMMAGFFYTGIVEAQIQEEADKL